KHIYIRGRQYGVSNPTPPPYATNPTLPSLPLLIHLIPPPPIRRTHPPIIDTRYHYFLALFFVYFVILLQEPFVLFVTSPIRP
ncbi:MAG: hypothetical protein JOS17DRAFT_722959, partial [Linnemannia elongata]